MAENHELKKQVLELFDTMLKFTLATREEVAAMDTDSPDFEDMVKVKMLRWTKNMQELSQ